jgi:hypothetical protein
MISAATPTGRSCAVVGEIACLLHLTQTRACRSKLAEVKRAFLFVAVAGSLFCLDGCSRRPNERRAVLVGLYRLHWGNGSNCSKRGIESSTLDLRADGTSEQRDRFKDGSQFVTPGKWYYEGDDNIRIQNLRITTTGEIDKNATATHAGVLVLWSRPPNIVLNPDDDCLFAKVQ